MASHRAPRGARMTRPARLKISAAALVAGLVVNGLMVWSGTSAAFTASGSNAGNNWATSSLAITDDDSGIALFTATGLVPGSTGSKCLTVTYGGNTASSVKLFASASSGTLSPYINLTVEEGTGGSFGSCTGFSGSSIYTGTLSGFTTTKTAYASGVGTWAPNASGSTRTYKFTYTLDAATPSSMQSTTAGVTFVWESQA